MAKIILIKDDFSKGIGKWDFSLDRGTNGYIDSQVDPTNLKPSLRLVTPSESMSGTIATVYPAVSYPEDLKTPLIATSFKFRIVDPKTKEGVNKRKYDVAVVPMGLQIVTRENPQETKIALVQYCPWTPALQYHIDYINDIYGDVKIPFEDDSKWHSLKLFVAYKTHQLIGLTFDGVYHPIHDDFYPSVPSTWNSEGTITPGFAIYQRYGNRCELWIQDVEVSIDEVEPIQTCKVVIKGTFTASLVISNY